MTLTVTLSIHPSMQEEWNLFKRRSAGGYGVSRSIMELVKADNRLFREKREALRNE